MIELPASGLGGLEPDDVATTRAGTPRAVRARALVRNPSGLIGLVLITIPVTLVLLDVSGLLPYDPRDAGRAEPPPRAVVGALVRHRPVRP